MKTIAFFSSDLGMRGGWSTFSKNVILGVLSNSNYKVIVLSPTRVIPNSLINNKRINFIFVNEPTNDSPFLRQFRTIATLYFNLISVDIVHSLIEPMNVLAHITHKITGAKLLLSLHGTYALKVLDYRCKKKYLSAYASATKIICVSNYTKSVFLMEFDEYKNKTDVINLGVNSKGNLCIPKFSERENSIIFIGHVKKRKGTLILTSLMADLRKKIPNIKLYIVGGLSREPLYAQEVVEKIEQSNLDKNIELKTNLTDHDLDTLMSKCKTLVVPSMNVDGHFEGFGLVHLEANLLGLPAIGSKKCGNEDAILEGVTGYLLDQGDTSGLIEKIEKIITNEHLWSEISNNAIKHAKSMTWEQTCLKYISLYESL